MWSVCRQCPRHRVSGSPLALMLLAGLPLVLCASAALADPMGSVQGVGNPRLMAEHPTISLDRELLVFEPFLGFVRVTAELEFHNHGDACEVPMEFPILTWHPGSGQDRIKELAVEVDGEPLEASEKPVGGIVLRGKAYHTKTYEFSVPFEADAPLHMKVRYYQTSHGLAQVPYVLASGGTWKGPIKDFRLEVRLGERLNFHDIRLTGDDRPLSYEESEGTLTWRSSDYDGDPELLWLHAGRGPVYVAVDAAHHRLRRGRYYRRVPTGEPVLRWHERPFVWHEGRLLVRGSFLGQITMAKVSRGVSDGTVTVTTEERTVAVPGLYLPIEHTGEGEPRFGLAFVEPQSALDAFGGSIRHGLTEQGDLWVALRSAPTDCETAARIALRADERCEYRLRCLRRLAEEWPETLRDIARELCGRTGEDQRVILAVVGHLADDPPEFATADAVLPRLRLTHREAPAHQLMPLVTGERDDALARGTGLVLAVGDPAGARDYILRIAGNRSSQSRTERRTLGLILREVKDQTTWEALADVIVGFDDGWDAAFGISLLGYLGEEQAIPFLSRLARGGQWEIARYSDGEAATALARIGSARALATCVDGLAAGGERYYTCRLLIEGLAAAAGAPREGLLAYPSTLPDWARPLSPEQARQVLAPLADQIQARAHKDLQDAVTALIGAIRAEPTNLAGLRLPPSVQEQHP